MNRTTPATQAREAIAALERRAELAEHRADIAGSEVSRLLQKIEKIERRMYEPTSRSITNFMQVSSHLDPQFDMKIIRLEPKMAQLALTNRDLFDARHSLEAIDRHIDRILQMHTDDLREQLRAAMWPRR